MRHPELRYGARGGTVRALQQFVSQAAHAKPGLARDGIFGPLTRAAVTRFQAAHRLDQDGVVGPRTWAALGESLRLPGLAASAPRITAVPAHPAARAAAASAIPRAAAPHSAASPLPAASQAPPAITHAPTPTRADHVGAADEPRWFQVALAEFQAHHTVFGTADGNRRIHEYFLATSYHPSVGTHEAWCSAFANWCMREAGLRGTGSASAASWLTWGTELPEPRHGCVMVIHWAGRHRGSGNHVTFFDHAAGERLSYFGGNQTMLHQISLGTSSRSAMATVHYRWPASGR